MRPAAQPSQKSILPHARGHGDPLRCRPVSALVPDARRELIHFDREGPGVDQSVTTFGTDPRPFVRSFDLPLTPGTHGSHGTLAGLDGSQPGPLTTHLLRHRDETL